METENSDIDQASNNNVDLSMEPASTVTYLGLTQEEFDEKYGRIPEESPTCRELVKKKCQCSRRCVSDAFISRFPVINMIRTYNFKEYVLGDIVSGLSVGVMTVPQSMGYALLAQVPPIMGLYTSFFPVVLYCLFSSSRHVAIGAMALSSLIIGSTVQKGTQHLRDEIEMSGNSTELLEELEAQTITIAVSVTFVSGLILILMSILKMSFIVSYIGEEFISGFLTGANLRVLTHQVRLMLGVTIKSRVGNLSWVYMVIDMLAGIPRANVASIIIAIICVGLLLFVKYFINERFKSKLPVPVPIDLMVVIISTLASYYGKFEERFGVDIVKEIPKGVPKPTVPSPEHMVGYIPDAFALAIINYLLMYMMAILFSKRHNYPCDPDQELFACGISNCFGGFFACIGCSSSPPRCFVMELTGGKTQLAYFISGILVLIIMLFLAPLLEALPVCVLASIILVACVPLFEQYRMCVTYWRTNKYDFSIWLVTAAVTLLTTIDTGMAVGIIYSFVVTVYKTQRPYTTTLVPSEHGILVDSKKYSNFDQKPQGVKIFSFDGAVYFATIDIFKAKLFKATVSPSELETLGKRKLLEQEVMGDQGQPMVTMNTSDTEQHSANHIGPTDSASKTDPVDDEAEKNGQANMHTPLTSRKGQASTTYTDDLHTIIVDCSRIAFTDTPGAKCFALLQSDYDRFGVRLLLAGCTEDVKAQFTRVPQCESLLSSSSLYPSVYDALAASQKNVPSKGLNIVPL